MANFRAFVLILLCIMPDLAHSQIVAAVLPASRAVEVGKTATVFATIVNAATSAATGCAIAPTTTVPATFLYQTTDPSTNAVTGQPNTPVTIPAGGFQTFVLAFTPTAAFAATDVALNFSCSNIDPAPSLSGINSVLLAASSTASADIVALAATTGNNGIVTLSAAQGVGAFAVATFNLGAADTITVSADTGANQLEPVNITLCQTDPRSGACLATPANTVSALLSTSGTPTFGVFVTGTNNVAPLYGANRVFVRFMNSAGNSVGATSVAAATQGYNPPPPSGLTFSIPNPLPNGTVRQAYQFSLCAPTPANTTTAPCVPNPSNPFSPTAPGANPQGGSPPYHCQLASGVGFPPIGMSISKDCWLLGTPSAAGTTTFRVCAVDLNGSQICQTTQMTVSPPGGTLTLENHVVTGTRPTSCASPAPVSVFQNGQAEADYWILLSGVTPGTTIQWHWNKPDGTVYLSDQTNISVTGDSCFWDTMYISGYVPSTTLGKWTVSALYNGNLLVSDSFYIVGPGTGQCTGEGGSNACGPCNSSSDCPGSAGCWFNSQPAPFCTSTIFGASRGSPKIRYASLRVGSSISNQLLTGRGSRQSVSLWRTCAECYEVK